MKDKKIMKILKSISLAIFSIILVVAFVVSNKSYSASGAIDLWSLPNDGSWYKDNTYFSVSFAHLVNYNNVYCIQKGQSFPSQGRYMQVKYIIDIEGETARIYKADKLYPDTGVLVAENVGPHNNLLAAIVSETEMQLGYGESDGNYNESQIALYYYWNDWIKEAGFESYIAGGSSNKNIVNNVGQNRLNYIMEKYREYASKYAYSAKIYYMTPVFNSVQRLILVERGDRTELNIDIPVEKVWLDGNNKFNTRTEITVELLANDKSTGKTLTLNNSNNWKGEFSDLEIKDENGNEIKYTIKEINVSDSYVSTITGDMDNGFKITNTLLTEVKVIKNWDDQDDLDEYRPSSIRVTLYLNGVSTGKTVTLSEENNWTATFTKLNKYDKNGNEINYTVQEETIPEYETPTYNKTEDSGNGYITWTITNKHTPHYDGYIEISGKVWVDKPDGKGNNIDGVYTAPSADQDSNDILKEGVTVRLKYVDENGNHQLFNPNLPNVYETKTNSNGEYTIRVNYDNSQNVYKLYEDVETVNKKLQTAYVEFEYDGMTYTTVASADTGANTSKATENENQRNTFDNNHSEVNANTTHPDNWADKDITATTNKVTSYENSEENRNVVIKYCNGDGTYIRTNPKGAWNEILQGTNDLACNSGEGHEIKTYEITVTKIPNINLGLFEREQPNVAIYSDLTKVYVTMNRQSYTYLYGVRGSNDNDVGLQAKFQNKGTYTYRRPVNPADIAYIQEEANTNAMTVTVTYEVKLANLSTTLPITVHNITNYFDTQYTLKTQGWTVTDGNGFKKATYNGDLNITVNPQSESAPIVLEYEVSLEAIRNLLNDEATLNNAVEIERFSTRYGEKTLYAEQRTGGRAGKPYGGYDYNSHPGNANVQLKTGDDGVTRLYPTDVNGNIIPTSDIEDDTDIAPSFVLCKDDEPKVLSGTVWEDEDSNISDNERIGDGKKSSEENTVANAKVELFKVNDDGSLTPAKLYKTDGTTATVPAVAYSNNDGYYSFGSVAEEYGVVTDRYVIKFTYGEGIDGSTSSTIDNVNISARDYKSTIISSDTEIYNLYKGTSDSETWHLNIDKGYSIAVDEIQERVNIEDLQYNNFEDSIYITAYSKPFKMQIEFDPTGTSSVLENGEALQNESGNLQDELNVFDFGIIERAREDIYAQKTVDYLKITLANGQVLLEGNPTEQNLSYVKAIGYSQNIRNGKEAREALEKQMLIEIDSELIQGATIEVRYAINVVNNSEVDYDYYVNGEIKTEYYYFGTNNVDNSPAITSSVNYLVDYVDTDFVYTWENEENWSRVTATELGVEGNELVNSETLKALNAGEYAAYATTQFSELAPGETSTTEHATAKKLLVSTDENVYENHIEILKIDAKSARTMSGKTDEGTPIVKTYKPGNYVPSTATRFTDDNVSSNVAGRHEQDDDVAKLIITPPTGLTSDIIVYVVTAMIQLSIVLAGIVYIKKKRLIK